MAGTAALVSIVDRNGQILLANPAMQRFTGRSAAELTGRPFWDVYVVPEEIALAQGAVAYSMATGENFSHEGDWLAEHGARRRVAMQNNVVVDETGHPYAIACIGLDVTEQRLREAQLHERARTDVLTGLGNRSALFEALEQHLDARSGEDCGVLFCDLDGFKAINDQHGHVTGDRLLTQVARRLLHLAGPDDVVARFGGDEFVLLCPRLDSTGLAAMAGRIEDRIREPFQGLTGPLHVGISIGASIGRPGEKADEVIARADRGMYGVKVCAQERRAQASSSEPIRS